MKAIIQCPGCLLIFEEGASAEHHPDKKYYHIPDELIERMRTIGDIEEGHMPDFIPGDVGVLLHDLLALLETE